MKLIAAKMLGKKVKELTTCLKNRLKNYATTVALPKGAHKKGRTNGLKNKADEEFEKFIVDQIDVCDAKGKL